jgi:hypothetical protein
MKSSYFKNIIGGALLAFSLLIGIGIASGITAQAQNPNYDQYRRDQDRYQRDQDRYRRDQDRYRRDQDRYRDWRRRGSGDDYPNWGGTFQLRQTALNAGYNEGIKQGRNDRGRRWGNDFRGQSTYQRATKDYSSRLGDRELYRQYFRLAYERGYQAGINGY